MRTIPMDLNQGLLASIVISSYNYARFLREAIDSALGQTYRNKEVIIVDDGSTDHSRDLISSYEDRITVILKENEGQASVFNAGLSVSSGEVVFYLDSDDVLLPTAVEQAIPHFDDPEVAKVHWPLRVIDEFGEDEGRVVPAQLLVDGDLAEAAVRDGPDGHAWPPTSGNAWSRAFLCSVLPIPAEFTVCPDLYLCALAPLYGLIRRVDQPQGFWRVHGANASWSQPFEERLRHQIGLWDSAFAALKERGSEKGFEIDLGELQTNSWWHKIERAVDEIVAIIPPHGRFILVDENEWGPGADILGRHRLPFLERNGLYWGRPPDDQTAIFEAERLRQSGADFIVFAWPAFWWLDHYVGFDDYLRSRFRCVVENGRIVIFDLRTPEFSNEAG